MILDCFTFFNELDLLEVRIRAFYDYVDKFVICEATYDHTGKEKPLYFDKDRFAFADDKIVHLVDTREPPHRDHDLTIEMFHRQFLRDEVRRLFPDDIILMGDVDEFPSREAIANIFTYNLEQTPLVMKQDLYYYNINCPRKKLWLGTVIMRGNQESGTIKTTRDNRCNYPSIESGWHFSYFMTPENIALKLKSFAHDTVAPLYSDKEYLLGHIKKNTNFMQKGDGNVEPKPIPDYIMSEMKKFPVFMGVYE